MKNFVVCVLIRYNFIQLFTSVNHTHIMGLFE